MIPVTKLRNDVEIPLLGLGTYKLIDEISEILPEAVKLGYRLIDTASYYNNETEIGQAIKDNNISREDLFITSKVWNDEQGYDDTITAFHKTLKRLDTDYLDLYLIHWPTEKSVDTWRAMESLYKEGKIRAIGVSNFSEENIEELILKCDIIPMINQVERHIYKNQDKIELYCKARGIVCEAWKPLNRNETGTIPLIKELALNYNKTEAQIVLRWQIQTGWIVFPKTKNKNRLEENANIFDFELTSKECASISALSDSV